MTGRMNDNPIVGECHECRDYMYYSPVYGLYTCAGCGTQNAQPDVLKPLNEFLKEENDTQGDIDETT